MGAVDPNRDPSQAPVGQELGLVHWAEGREKECWASLQQELKDVAAKIDERNKTRPDPFMNCHPNLLQCAISV